MIGYRLGNDTRLRSWLTEPTSAQIVTAAR